MSSLDTTGKIGTEATAGNSYRQWLLKTPTPTTRAGTNILTSPILILHVWRNSPPWIASFPSWRSRCLCPCQRPLSCYFNFLKKLELLNFIFAFSDQQGIGYCLFDNSFVTFFKRVFLNGGNRQICRLNSSGFKRRKHWPAKDSRYMYL